MLYVPMPLSQAQMSDLHMSQLVTAKLRATAAALHPADGYPPLPCPAFEHHTPGHKQQKGNGYVRTPPGPLGRAAGTGG